MALGDWQLQPWAAAVATLSTLAWAGARHSTAGGLLHRDGAVGKSRVDREQCQFVVIDGEACEQVTLTREDGVVAQCTCGVRRCPHAVAAVLELQKRCRAAQTKTADREATLVALRERLRPATPEPAPRQLLRDLDRLPTEAAVDMVALTWRQLLRPTAGDVAELARAADRVLAEAHDHPAAAAAHAVRLLQALGAAKVVFAPLPEEAERHAGRMADVAAAAPQPPLPALFALVQDGHPQVGPRCAAALSSAAHRDPAMAVALADLLAAWFGQADAPAWREHGQLTATDLLAGAVVDALLAGDAGDRALHLALLWPPPRSALLAAVQAWTQRGHHAAVRQILGRYDPRGATYAEAAVAAFDAALHAGQRQAAWEIAAQAIDRWPTEPWYDRARRACPPDLWPARRNAWLARALADDDPPWLGPQLAAEADAEAALLFAVRTAPQRDQLANAALPVLQVLNPAAAAQAAQLRLLALTTAASPSDARLHAAGYHLLKAAKAAELPDAGSPFLLLLYAAQPRLRLLAELARMPV